ncbi:MAG: MFS transporter [Lentisphaeria bacterium]|nr:MFS transporter [Lentisphaeria bacterium]
MIREEGIRIQSIKLGLLTFVHFLADSTCGVLPGILPVVMTYFGLDLSYGVAFISLMGIGCNLMQIPISKLGSSSASPIWICFGLLLIGSYTFMGFLPETTPFPVICLLILLSALGISLVHPTGLRGVQALDKLPAGMTTPLFMTGGFLGAAFSPLIAGILAEQLGLKGLIIFFPIMLLTAFLIRILRVKLATDTVKTGSKGEVESAWSFWTLFWFATFLNCGSAAFSGLVPYMLNKEIGFSLSFGNVALLLFGGGSSAVSVILGMIASKRRVDGLLLALMFLGIPFTILYFLLADHPWAIVFALLCGTLCSSVFPIFVAMSKTAAGKYSLGVRMGLMVGGTWGIAGLVFLGIGIFANHYSARTVLLISVPAFYFLSAVLALCMRKREKE